MPKRKKNFHHSFFKTFSIYLSIIFWLITFYIFFFIDPEIWSIIYYTPFFISILFSIFFTLCLFIKRRIISALISIGITTILFLRSLSFKEIYFPILVILIVITLIYFFTIEDHNDKLETKSEKLK